MIERLPASDVSTLSDEDLFSSDVDAMMDYIWTEREARLRVWAAEGLSQRAIAERTSRDQKTVSNWQRRFGIESSQPKKVRNSSSLDPEHKPRPAIGQISETDCQRIHKWREQGLSRGQVAEKLGRKDNGSVGNLIAQAEQWHETEVAKAAAEYAEQRNAELVRRLAKKEPNPHPDTPAGNAARKAEGLLSKAASVKPVEAEVFARKALELISAHNLSVKVSVP